MTQSLVQMHWNPLALSVEFLINLPNQAISEFGPTDTSELVQMSVVSGKTSISTPHSLGAH